MFSDSTQISDLDLNDVLGHIYDDENEIPTCNSKYYDMDEVKSLFVDQNLNMSEYSCLHINIRSLPDKLGRLCLIISELQSDGIIFDFILLCETFFK